MMKRFLELWHGPTLAFKDIALQFLPHLMQAAKQLRNDQSKILILTATSGDTGKAAMEGFSAVEDFEVLVFYPYQGVSSFQKRQMLTREADNVRAIAVKGDFDTCQRGVKDIFVDQNFNLKMAEQGYELSSANSINIGRLVPQMNYYIYSYLQAVKTNKISYGEPLNVLFLQVILVTFAACYIRNGTTFRRNSAANQNNVWNFFFDGTYNANRDLVKTSS